MDTKEIAFEMNLSYLELCSYLQNKNGIPSGNYFRTPTCKSKNPKITRTSDGLIIHHIKENEHILLSTPKIAVTQPFEYQLSQNLLYCNYLEHLLLHVKIVKEYNINNNGLGIGGVELILKDIIEMFDNECYFLPKWQRNCFLKIKDNYNSIGEILHLLPPQYLYKIF